MDDGVSVWHRDVPYENSRPARGPGAHSAEGVPPGACFFGSFLCTSKERDAPAASGAMREQEDPSRKAIEQSVIVDVGTVARRVEIATP